MTQAITMQGHSAATATSGGGAVWLDNLNQGLDTAFKGFAYWEQMQRMKDGSGQSVATEKLINTKENGSATVIDGSPVSPGQEQAKSQLDKAAEVFGITGKALLGGVALIGLAYYATR